MKEEVKIAGGTELNLEGKEENIRQFLTFHVGSEAYGIEVNNVREVIEYEEVFRIPAVPGYISGVINLRGEVVPVIDLAYRFFHRTSEITKLSCIVIVEVESGNEVMLIGFVIDAINAVLDLPGNSIEPTPSFGAKIRSEFISGVGKVNDKFIILLHVNKVLDIDELSDFENNMER